jgi:manganese/zinc/iron transport system permease protein
MEYNTQIVLAGTSLMGVCAGLVGSFAVLRRRALIGDTLAHAALPGLCLAFLIVGHRSLPAMLFGALLSGLVGVLIITALRYGTRIKEDAAMGIVLSVFYGAGIALSRYIQNQSTAGSKAGLESYILGKPAGMILQDLFLIGGTTLACLLLIVLLYKEFKVVLFDSQFASVQGWPALRLDLLLMAMIAVAVVIGLPAVGVVMMAALLIIPAATARLWTERLALMLVISALFGATIGGAGTLLSARFAGLPTGPVIVLLGSGLFGVSLLFAPRSGFLARWLDAQNFRTRIGEQALLCELYNLTEPSLPSLVELDRDTLKSQRSWSDNELSKRLTRLNVADLIKPSDNSRITLTPSGYAKAAQVARAHRLWQLFIESYPDSAPDFTDLDAETIDEKLDQEIVVQLEDRLRSAGRLPKTTHSRTRETTQ